MLQKTNDEIMALLWYPIYFHIDFRFGNIWKASVAYDGIIKSLFITIYLSCRFISNPSYLHNVKLCVRCPLKCFLNVTCCAAFNLIMELRNNTIEASGPYTKGCIKAPPPRE